MWHKYKYPVYLLLVALLCYWPYTFFQSSLLCDDLDVALPTKYFAGECYRNGLLPLWNPYQIWGFPAHADLQYTNWNIEVLLVGILGGYSYLTLHLLFLGYIFLTGFGMYLLSRYLCRREPLAFLVACIYMLSGILLGHAQSLVTVLGMTWMPFVILAFLKLLEQPGMKRAIELALYAYLFMTMGYQAFAFMLMPLLLALFIHKTIQCYRAKDLKHIRRLFLYNALTVVFIIAMLSPLIITQVQSQPFVSRLNGMPLNEVMSNPFPPAATVSFINPMLTVGNDEVFNTDVSMRNMYFGLIPLGFIVLAFLRKRKTSLDIILLTVAAVYLLGAFGDALPVRKWMYELLPGFRLFRFPSLLRIVAFICILCYASLHMEDTFASWFQRGKGRRSMPLVLLAMALAGGLYGVTHTPQFTLFQNANGESFFIRLRHCSGEELACYMALLQVLVLAVFLVCSMRLNFPDTMFSALTLCVIAELVITGSLYGRFTAFTNEPVSLYQRNFAHLQQHFPYPSRDAVTDNRAKYNWMTGFWRNTGCFKKQLSLGDEWTSYYFANFDEIVNRQVYLRDSLERYPFVYFSKPHASEIPVSLPIDTRVAFIKETFHAMDAKGTIRYKAFTPNHMSMECNTPSEAVLNIQQSYFTGWQILVDGVETTPLWNVGLLMSVPLKPGTHTVEMTFTNPAFVTSLAFSHGVILVLLVFLCLLAPWPAMQKSAAAAGIILIAGMLWMLWNRNREGAEQKPSNTFAFRRSTFLDKHAFGQSLDLGNKADFRALMEYMRSIDPTQVDYIWNNYYNSPELWYAIRCKDHASDEMNGQVTYQPQPHKQGFVERFEQLDRRNPHTDTLSFDGSLGRILNRQDAYTPAKTIDAKGYEHGIYGTLWMNAARGIEPFVVCGVKHADGKEESLYFPLLKYYVPDATWQQVPYYLPLQEILRPGDQVILFVMNDRDQALRIDNWSYEAW